MFMNNEQFGQVAEALDKGSPLEVSYSTDLRIIVLKPYILRILYLLLMFANSNSVATALGKQEQLKQCHVT